MAPSIPSDLNQQYIEMRRALYKKFFTALMTLFSIMPVIEACRALYRETFGILLSSLVVLVFGAIFYYIIIATKKYMDISITVFNIIFYFAAMIANYYGDTKHFDNSLDAFYFGYTCSYVEMTIKNRIPNFLYQVIFASSCFLIREIFIPAHDKSGIVVHLLMFGFSLYMDYDREKHDQTLFGSYFYSKEQLTKFKDLVVNDIPDSIVILTQDITRCLFANSSFLSLADGDYNSNISAFLNKLLVQEALGDSSVSTERSTAASPTSKQTLLGFIKNIVRGKEANHIDEGIKKTSCNVVYKRNSGLGKAVTSLEQLEQTPEYSFEVKIMPLVWDEKAAIGIIFHDITQQNTILKLKIAANLQKDRILATVSHELRTPLNSMLGMIDILMQQVRESEMIHYLSICKNSGYLLLGLVNSILDLNLIRANKLKLVIEEIRIHEFLKDIIRLFEIQCTQKSIYLKLKVSSLLPKLIATDKNRLSQIIINLVGNALKFTQEGGITVKVEPSPRKGFMMFSVEDTGLGIKEEDRNKLFRMFGKLDHQDTVVNNQGVGLGLTISNNLAKVLCKDKHLGGIRVESEYKKGSKFWFILPVYFNDSSSLKEIHQISCDIPSMDLDEGEIEENKSTSVPAMQLNVRKPKNTEKDFDLQSPTTRFLGDLVSPMIPSRPHVLIVDDNPLNLTVAEYFVRSEQYETKTALYGQIAIEIVLKNNHKLAPIRLILMDLQMPVMDGYQTTKKLRELMESGKIPEIPIVALTANDSQNDKKYCLQVGMKDHLSKPLQKSELRRVLNAYT